MFNDNLLTFSQLFTIDSSLLRISLIVSSVVVQRHEQNKSDHAEFFFGQIKLCICQNKIVILTFDTCPLKYNCCEGK